MTIMDQHMAEARNRRNADFRGWPEWVRWTLSEGYKKRLHGGILQGRIIDEILLYAGDAPEPPEEA